MNKLCNDRKFLSNVFLVKDEIEAVLKLTFLRSTSRDLRHLLGTKMKILVLTEEENPDSFDDVMNRGGRILHC